MDSKKGTATRNRNVFRGSVFISLLVESHPGQFPSRGAAFRLARRLFREGHIHSIVGARDFEDSAQLYMWRDGGPSQRERDIISAVPASTSNSKPHSSPEKKNHRNLDWQLIEDIRTKLLNRSEAYNIVTSYNTFFQELQQDFGYSPNSGPHKKPPPPTSDLAWSGCNIPFTSTLELKKGAGKPTNSHLLHPTGFQNFADGVTHTKITSKLSPTRPHHKNPSAKDNPTRLSQETSPDLNPLQQNRRPRNQRQQQHRHHNGKHHHQSKTGADMMNKQQSSSGNSVERLVSTDQPRLSSPASTDYRGASNQHGAPATGKKSAAAVENTENKNTRNAEHVSDVAGDRRTRRPPEPHIHQFPQAPLEMQTWLNQGVTHFSGSQGWVPENRRHEDESGLAGASMSRWPDNVVIDGMDGGRRWPESTYSYSDNEKQLLEEMRRMKKEHQNVLRTYEGRINKLMTKMHELRNIAEMLEHSSNKSSPYAVLPGKLALMNILGRKAVDGKNAAVDSGVSESDQVPPPLPPRPGRGSRVYPNKPIIHSSVTMKPLFWSRIILENDSRGEQARTVWHGMTEPKIDTDELQRLFSGSSDFPSEVSLYDDIILRRGRNQSQLMSIYDAERSQRITSELRALHCTLPDVIQAFVTLNCDGLHTDSFAELLELLMSPRELDKISHHIKTRGAGQLDAPEYMVFELSKVDHFRERLDFLRFKNKVQINLFEIDQQLRELQTACEEMTSSISLKHVLETVLAVGNHMNAGTDRGQADGFRVDILTSLKDMQDLSKQCNLLELVMRIYCLKFESNLDFGCPTRFRLPEPSNMRHAAQVSFEDIQRALKELKEELSIVRNKLESLSKREGSTLTAALKVTSENFMMSAMEVLVDEQKLLEDTRAQFWKTASYFSFDGQKSTPREFFQIWAAFLHDCKYYWKLAHRNLAKAKFNTDLVTKSQLSCSSLPGFNSLKSAMMKHVASFQQDEEMRSSKSQQLQHISSWIQSVGRYTMEMQPDPADLSLDTNDVVGRHPGALTGYSQMKLQPQQEQNHVQGPSSPPYKNQTLPESRNFVHSMADVGKQFELKSKPAAGSVRTMPMKSSRHISSEELQAPSSPKPIKATPPNVIKPQPTVHTSHTPSLDQNIANQVSYSSGQPTVAEVRDIHRYSSINHEDTSGFEPLYESLSHYSQNFRNLQSKDASANPRADVSAFASPASTLSPDHDNTHKKNSKFFKSLLKRDQKRHEDSPQDVQAAPFKSTSTPFSKVKNTFVHKFSASGNNKNSNSDNQKYYNRSHLNPDFEASNKQLPLDHTAVLYSFPNREDVHFDNSRGDATEGDCVKYQNLCFPYHSRPNEGLRHAHTSNSLDAYPRTTEQTFYRGHESFPSTVSSLQSIRNKERSHYQGNILQRQDVNPAEQDLFNKASREANHVLCNPISRSQTDSIREEPASQSSQARVRAPIALGSNLSISEVYGKGTENAETQTSGTYDYQSTHAGSGDLILEKVGSSSKAAATSAVSDPKWVKASPVPVYKAKLIPNYENQSKYDPRFEGGVRGRAEAVAPPVHAPPVHAPQVSISSDVYRQELQKKSEQYIGGSMCPTSGQTPTSSNSLRGSSSQGASTLPSKPNHYHAFPIIVSHGIQQVSPLPGSISISYPRQGNIASEFSQGTASNQTNEIKNNPENGEAVLSADYSPQQNRSSNGRSPANFLRSSERKLDIARSCNAMPIGVEKDRAIRGEHFSAHRSSSAHSVLDRDSEFRRRDMGVHTVPARSESQEHRSHVSRKNVGGGKATPTSHREHSEMKSDVPQSVTSSEVKRDVPQSVTSLIDKFEKGTDMNHLNIGLLEISDKPPSMTSTPVARRRNQGVSTTQPNQEKQLAVSRSGAESGRSLSEGTKRSLFPKETVITEWHRNATMEDSANNNLALRDHPFSDHQIQPSDTHQFQSQLEEKDRTRKSRGTLKQSEDYEGTDHQARNYQQSGHFIPRQFQQSDQNTSPGESYVVMYPGNQTQQEFNHYELPNRWSDSHTGHSNIDRMLGTASNVQLQPDDLTNSHHNQANQTSGQSSSPKPDPQNPHLHLLEPSRQQQNRPRWFDSAITSHGTSGQQQPHAAISPGYDNLPQHRQPAPVSHSSGLTPQVQTSQSYGSMNSTSSSSPQRRRHNEDFHGSSKPPAFEPLARAGPVNGRQPGAMAVVKPTVMNI